MRFTTHLPDNSPVLIIMSNKVSHRLADTCFRGNDQFLAGNFRDWMSMMDMCEDDDFLDPFLQKVQKVADQDRHQKTQRCEVSVWNLDGVGWSSTINRDSVDDSDLKAFDQPEWRSWTVMRVKPESADRILAPVTCKVTVAYRLVLDGCWKVIIQSIYPGPDIGRLKGNLTNQPWAMLDWNHPGA